MAIWKLMIGYMVLVIALVFSGSAAADTEKINPMMAKKYAVWIGGFFPDLDTTISINGETLPDNPNLSLEKVLGLDDSKSVLWGGGNWQISRRNFLEIEFANLNRDGSNTVVTDPIQIGDSIARVGAQIDTTFDMTIARLTYGFSVVKKEKMTVRLKAGVHLADFALDVQLSGAVEECEPGEIPPDCAVIGGQSDQLETSDITFPLPHFGASFEYAITPKLAMRAQALGFALEINNIEGSLLELDADIVYHPWEHVGFGAGFRYFNANVESKGSRLNGEFDFEYFGPVIYGVVNF